MRKLVFKLRPSVLAKWSSLAATVCSYSSFSHIRISPTGMLVSRPKSVFVIACLCWLVAAYLAVTGILAAFGVQPLRSGAFLLEGFELMGPVIFFLTAVVTAAIGFALIKRLSFARRLAILLFALVGFAAIPALSSAVLEFRWLTLTAEGAKLLVCVLVIFELMQPDVVDYLQR